MEFSERDRNAVAYSKAGLHEGDTLVIIKYPANCEVFDHTGFRLDIEHLRVHSDKLLATGSKKFKELLSEWPQSKFKRRNGYASGLPTGIKYILNLTPPDEGDEAVELTTELSCSPGIRHWYSAERRCKVSVEVCGGKDEVAKPVKAKTQHKDHRDLVDALADADFTSELSIVNNINSYDMSADDVYALEELPRPAPSTGGTLQQREERELKEALDRSKQDCFNHQPATPKAKDRYQSIDEVLEYCPIRHRAGIERLLQLIEGKEPRLDSAPKVWTLFVLAKYFDCTKVVVDFIVAWTLREPNCQFIEILPEATLKMGLGLKSSMLTRPAFAILVSEHALSTVSRECGSFDADKANTNQFGRVREDIDEDALSAVQEAAYSFISRIENALQELCHRDMLWFNKLPEYQKINHVTEWVKNNEIGEDEKRLINDDVARLKSDLSHFVRGRILWCLNRELDVGDSSQANNHRIAESYLKEYEWNFCNQVYIPMAEKEKMMTRFPWKALTELGTHTPSNLLLDTAGVSEYAHKQFQMVAKRNEIQRVTNFDLTNSQSKLNWAIIKAIQRHDYNFGRIPDECFHPRTSWPQDVEDSTVIGEGYNWGLPTTSNSPKALPKLLPKTPLSHLRQDTFQAGIPGAMSRTSDILERFETNKSSTSSTTDVMIFPLRLKECEATPLLEKEPTTDDPFVSGGERPGSSASKGDDTMTMTSSLINRISSVINASSAFLSTQHTLTDPRAQAIDLHNRSVPFDSAVLSSPTKPLPCIPTIQEKPSPFNASSKRFEPCIPNDLSIERSSPLFSLRTFFEQVQQHVQGVADTMLHRDDELDFTVLTDTLLCLTDEEWKYLPLWAGGLNDGSGGVFAPMVPPAPAGAGPSGPGPAFHTGYSMASRDGTEMSFDGASTIGVDTSVAVEDGYSDHIDRRRVMSENESDFHSEAFSDDMEDYVGERENGGIALGGFDDLYAYVGKGKGKEVTRDNITGFSDEPERSATPKPEGLDEPEWDGSDEEEPFDFGGEDDEEMSDEDEDEDEDFAMTL